VLSGYFMHITVSMRNEKVNSIEIISLTKDLLMDVKFRVATFWETWKNDQRKDRNLSRSQGICMVRENCLYNKELNTHNHDLFNVL
jgi:hypothetical protein